MQYYIRVWGDCRLAVPSWCIAGTFEFLGHEFVIHRPPQWHYGTPSFVRKEWRVSHVASGMGAGNLRSRTRVEALMDACFLMLNNGSTRTRRMLAKVAKRPYEK
jgi:hypothetical protein